MVRDAVRREPFSDADFPDLQGIYREFVIFQGFSSGREQPESAEFRQL